MQRNATRCAEESCAGASQRERLGRGYACKRFVIHDVVLATLDVMREAGGAAALAAIQRGVPAYDIVATL